MDGCWPCFFTTRCGSNAGSGTPQWGWDEGRVGGMDGCRPCFFTTRCGSNAGSGAPRLGGGQVGSPHVWVRHVHVSVPVSVRFRVLFVPVSCSFPCLFVSRVCSLYILERPQVCECPGGLARAYGTLGGLARAYGTQGSEPARGLVSTIRKSCALAQVRLHGSVAHWLKYDCTVALRAGSSTIAW